MKSQKVYTWNGQCNLYQADVDDLVNFINSNQEDQPVWRNSRPLFLHISQTSALSFIQIQYSMQRSLSLHSTLRTTIPDPYHPRPLHLATLPHGSKTYKPSVWESVTPPGQQQVSLVGTNKLSPAFLSCKSCSSFMTVTTELVREERKPLQL